MPNIIDTKGFIASKGNAFISPFSERAPVAFYSSLTIPRAAEINACVKCAIQNLTHAQLREFIESLIDATPESRLYNNSPGAPEVSGTTPIIPPFQPQPAKGVFDVCSTDFDHFLNSAVVPGLFSFPGNILPPWTNFTDYPGQLASDGTWIYSTETFFGLTGIIGNSFEISFDAQLSGALVGGIYTNDIHFGFFTAGLDDKARVGYITTVVPVDCDESDPSWPNQLGIGTTCRAGDLGISDNRSSPDAQIIHDAIVPIIIKKTSTQISIFSPRSSVIYPIQPNLGPLELALGFWRQISTQIPRIKNLQIQVID